MPITTAPALLAGLGARLLLDHFNREGSSGAKDFILLGTWQGVALHYATKNSGTAGFGALVAFAIGIKLFIEFNLDSDLNKCIITVFGIALGVVFTDVLSGYIDHGFSGNRQKSSARTGTKKPRQPATEKPEKKRERTVQFRPNVSDITSVDDGLSDKMGPMSSLPPHEREIHVLRMRAALADSERRRCKEERKWAVSQGNPARASQMKWEVKRYSALMETFNKEAEEKTAQCMCFCHPLTTALTMVQI